MSWFSLAIGGHLANAGAFVIDKALLTSSVKHSTTYAGMIGLFSLATVVAAPWAKDWPPLALLPAILGFGAFFVFALWTFFEALQRAETTRVVPIVGSLVPVFTLCGTMFFFAERLTERQGLGFGLLLIATILLTRGGSKNSRLNLTTVGLATISALLFAAASLSGKYVFEHMDFVGAFVASRVAAGLTGILILAIATKARQELFHLFTAKKTKPQKNAPRHPVAWMVVGQASGAIGFLCVHLAIADGSAAIVNALQAVQYAAIVLVAWFGGKQLATLLHEERTGKILLIKSSAIICVAIGLVLISTT